MAKIVAISGTDSAPTGYGTLWGWAIVLALGGYIFYRTVNPVKKGS